MISKPFSDDGADGGCPTNEEIQQLKPWCGKFEGIDANNEFRSTPAPHFYDRPGYVYFFFDGSEIKIGWSKDPDWRIIQLERERGRPLRILKIIDGTLRQEARIHERFADLHQGGEWFRDTPELREFIAGLEDASDAASPTIVALTRFIKRHEQTPAVIVWGARARFCVAQCEAGQEQYKRSAIQAVERLKAAVAAV